MSKHEPFGLVPVAFYGKLEESPLSQGPRPASIHVLALTPKLLHEQAQLLLGHLEAGSRVRLLLTGGLAALAWGDVRRTVIEHFKALDTFRDSLRETGCDHRFEVRELDWTPSVGMLQVGEGETGSLSLVSVYTPDPKADRQKKTVLKLTLEGTPDLFSFYSEQFLSLWRGARHLDPEPMTRARSLRRAAVERFQDILETVGGIEIAFVIALSEELEEFLEIMGDFKAERDPETGQYTYHFDISGRQCVAILSGTMGHTVVAQLVERLVTQHAVGTVISIGIAGSISKDVGVSDVVVASQVNSYIENAKATEHPEREDFTLQLGGQATKTTHQFQDEALHLRFARPDVWKAWQEDCREQAEEIFGESLIYRPSDAGAAILFDRLVEGGKDTILLTDAALRHGRIHLSPGLHADDVHIASGPIVGADKHFIQWLRRFGDRKVVAMEMEAGGVISAAHWRAQPLRTLVVRGISDLADGEKGGLEGLFGKSLRRIAMRNAASLMKHMLEVGLLKDLASRRKM